MQPVKINIKQPLTYAELFFVQKSLELLYRDTLDTYRLRLNNPKSIFQEIKQVIPLVEAKSLKEIYAKTLLEEAKDLLDKEDELTFTSIQKGYVKSILVGSDFNIAYYAINMVLKENEDYLQVLYNRVQAEITKLNTQQAFNPEEYHLLNRLISYLMVELRSKGFSKEYLHRFIRSIFALTNPLDDFAAAYQAIGTLIMKPEEKYTVYVGFKGSGLANAPVIQSSEIVRIEYQDIKTEAAQINTYFEHYVKQFSYLDFYKVEVTCQDYFHASYVARQKLQKALDILFMGHSNLNISLHHFCFVVGENNPKKGNRQLLRYQLDGQFASDQQLYLSFLQKMNDLKNLPLDEISNAKLYSGLRYLRLGTIADELENKLLNYWIAMEYLFSAIEGDKDKVARLKVHFKKMHSLSYVTRIFSYVNKSIERLGLQGSVSHYDAANLSYLIHQDTLTEIMAIASQYPLLAYRLHALLNQRFKDSKALIEDIERHQKNLERNIIRIYRLRNEIVHNAAKEKGIQDITAHLRYYLTFVINGFLEFCLNHPVDINKDGKISLDDYFAITSLQLDSLMADKTLDISKMLKFTNPIEYLS